MQIVPGARFGRLDVLKEIARGAFAAVYLARDTLIDRTVALKVMRATPAQASERERRLILREARLAGRLSSPHIVTLYHVHDLGEEGWVVELEYVDGPTLEQVLQERGTLPVDEALRVLRGVLSALHVAHDNNVIHRDVKPGNVLLGAEGAIKLTDFGLSGMIGADSMSLSSLEGLMGTPHYVAPEVIEGRSSTVASDLWSVGVMAFRMLSGRMPFEASVLPDLFDAIRQEPPAPIGNAVPPGLVRLVFACLDKDPAGRPRSAAHLLAALEDVAPAP